MKTLDELAHTATVPMLQEQAAQLGQSQLCPIMDAVKRYLFEENTEDLLLVSHQIGCASLFEQVLSEQLDASTRGQILTRWYEIESQMQKRKPDWGRVGRSIRLALLALLKWAARKEPMEV